MHWDIDGAVLVKDAGDGRYEVIRTNQSLQVYKYTDEEFIEAADINEAIQKLIQKGYVNGGAFYESVYPEFYDPDKFEQVMQELEQSDDPEHIEAIIADLRENGLYQEKEEPVLEMETPSIETPSEDIETPELVQNEEPGIADVFTKAESIDSYGQLSFSFYDDEPEIVAADDANSKLITEIDLIRNDIQKYKEEGLSVVAQYLENALHSAGVHIQDNQYLIEDPKGILVAAEKYKHAGNCLGSLSPSREMATGMSKGIRPIEKQQEQQKEQQPEQKKVAEHSWGFDM